jgi:hypothetical protein
METLRVSPQGRVSHAQGCRSTGPAVLTMQRAVGWSTRGFNSLALSSRAGVFDDAFVTCQYALICVNNRLPESPIALRHSFGTKRRSVRGEGSPVLGVRIHAQQNEMNEQTDFQKTPAKVTNVPARKNTTVSAGWSCVHWYIC